MEIDVFTLDGAPAGRIAVTAKGPRTLFEYTGGSVGGVMRLALLGAGAALSLGIPVPEGGELRLSRTLTRLELGDFDPERARGVLTETDTDLAALAAAPPWTSSEEPAPEPEPERMEEQETGDEHIPESVPEPEPGPETVSEPVLEPKSVNEHETGPETVPEPETEPEEVSEAERAPARLVPAPEEGWYLEPDPGRHVADPELREAAAGAGGAWVRFEGADTLLAFPWSPSQPFPMIPIFRLGAAATMAGRDFMLFRLRDGAPV